MSAVCGAVGQLAASSDARENLYAMLASLQTRGPDGASEYLNRAGQIMLGFGFLRTAPSEQSPAVLANEDRTLFLVCDGHVFNDADLRPILRGKSHTYAQEHSAETLLHLYEDEGLQGFRRVDGQFAAALWDSRRKQLILVRDFLGVRPLYYWNSPEGVVFSSEIKSLLRHSQVPCAVDETAVSQFLTFTSVPGPRTLFRDVRKVPPGMAAVCSLDGSVQVEPYWDLLANPMPESDDERYYVERVRDLHSQALRRRSIESPIAALLSGGNDSSANASLLARHGSRPLHTFTVGLAGMEGQDQYNDLAYARKVADALRSDHHERLVSIDEFLETIPVTIDAMEDLVSEPSSVFLYHALRMAKDKGLRVIITGEANDELSCGHGGMIDVRHGYYRRWVPYLRKPAIARRWMARLAPVMAPKRLDVLSRAAAGDEYFWSYETAWMDTDKQDVLSSSVASRAGQAAVIVRACKQRFDASGHANRDYLSYVIYSMMQDFYFGNLMLGKLDSLSSSLGLEARCPYTDPAYAHFVYNIPAQFKAKDGLVKYFFKKAIEGLLPDEIVYRPKQGFRTPVVELFQGVLGDWAEPILMETGLTRVGMLKQEHLADILHRHRKRRGDYANRLWTAMTLNLWYDRWIRSVRPTQSAGCIPSRYHSDCVTGGAQ
ncbi:MAG TPA: asparagine synthase (glutamine-hydrolyzing) [Candidatus Acidoferrales bacterium]|nr:asparagine synthase (glutamine-hydrolyzing) [Candidatus Acidoferrales bacterium]